MAMRRVLEVRTFPAAPVRNSGRSASRPLGRGGDGWTRLRQALIGVVGFLVVAMFATPLPARAHASVAATTPADGATIDQAPAEYSITFNEAVTIPAGGLRVYDGQGERVDLGDSGGGEAAQVATVGLTDGLGDGAYIATFRAVSADGHPIRGAFVFQVGAGGQAPDRATVDGLLAAGDDQVWAGVGAGLRFASYAAALVVIGWALLANVLHAGPSSLPRTLAAVCAGASLLQIPAFAAEVTGLGAGALLSGAALIEAATSSVGQAAVLRAGLIAAAVWAPGPLRMVAAVAAAASELVTGHTRTVDPAWLMLPADLVHVVASAVWTGGLVIIFTEWRRHDEAWRATALARFSNVALVSVVSLSLAGGAMAWATVRSPEALMSTTYGRALLVKVGVVVAVLVVAAANRRLGASASGLERVWRNVRIELVGIGLVVGVTSVLVGTQPAADAAGLTGPSTATVTFGEGLLDVVADPGEAGLNELHLYVLDPSGLPADVTGDATVLLSLPASDIGPIEREPIVAGTGHFLLRGPELAVPGEWQITFVLRTSAFDQTVAEATVTIR